MVHSEITYRLEKARDGTPTLVVREGDKEVYLHGKYRPREEAHILQKSFNPEKYDTLVVLGLGLGYHLAPLSEMTGYRRIVVVEALEGLDKEIAGIPETAFLSQGGPIVLLTGLSAGAVEAKLEELLSLEGGRGIQVLEHPQSMRVFPGYYGEIKTILQQIINGLAGDTVTRMALGSRFFRNAVINLLSMEMHRGAASFAGRFSGMAALAVTSGPSLVKNLDVIREYAGRAFIITVDSALPVLTRNGIIPDFCVSIDPQPYILEHLMKAASGKTVPIVTMTSEPRVFRKTPGILSLNTHPVSQLLEELFPGLIGSFNSATGTVAGDAVTAAIAMGFDSVALTGFDFSFPGYEIYARGSAYQDRYAGIFQDRFNPVESRNLTYIMKTSGGIRDGSSYSRRSFLRYREALEEKVLKNSPTALFTAVHSPELKYVRPVDLRDYLFNAPDIPRDKHSLITKIADSSSRLGKTAPLSEIRRVLNDPVMKRLITASLGESVPVIEKAMQFYHRILG